MTINLFLLFQSAKEPDQILFHQGIDVWQQPDDYPEPHRHRPQSNLIEPYSPPKAHPEGKSLFWCIPIPYVRQWHVLHGMASL